MIYGDDCVTVRKQKKRLGISKIRLDLSLAGHEQVLLTDIITDSVLGEFTRHSGYLAHALTFILFLVLLEATWSVHTKSSINLQC